VAIDFGELARSTIDEKLQEMIAAGDDEWVPGALAAERAELARRGVEVIEPASDAPRPRARRPADVWTALGIAYGAICILGATGVAVFGELSFREVFVFVKGALVLSYIHLRHSS
jgi:hypothetical protein